jgi:acyl-CoA synthetase (AMP-forming)/AMP-acid ligase II
MVKIKGATVYPTEVEAALRAVPAVRQAFVTDVTPDDAGGAPLIGALVLVPEGTALADVVAEVRARLSAFKVPTRWVLTADPAVVPLLATGKVDKAGLQDLIRATGVATR